MLLPFLLGACSEAPPVVVAPTKVTRALSVIADLSATAQLHQKDHNPQTPKALERGADGVTFSGFLNASPGSYTLYIAFYGVAFDDKRHFLGRLASDSFTVTEGQVVDARFSSALDTIGRASDHGDADQDQLGFLDEILLGSRPDSPDSDGDGLMDGKDCLPTSSAGTFAIIEGGSHDDCDADSFASLDAPLGPRGGDCLDTDAAVHPGLDDNCATATDEDCNPSTCPPNDAIGPTVTILAPQPEALVGCQGEIRVKATDPSGTVSINAALPESPYVTGALRQQPFTEEDDGDDDSTTSLWQTRLLGMGPGLSDEVQPLVVRATDGNGNTSEVRGVIQYLLSPPTVQWDAPASLDPDDPLTVTLAPTGDRPLSSLRIVAGERRNNGTVFFAVDRVVVAELDPAGETVTFSPSAYLLDEYESGVAFAVEAVDDIGNRLAPFNTTSVFAEGATGNMVAEWPCEAVSYRTPAAALVRREHPPVSALDLLAEARTHLDTPELPLVGITMIGPTADGRIDLGSAGNRSICYLFRASTGPSFNVCWFSPAYFVVDQPRVTTGDFGSTTPLTEPLVDSTIVSGWSCNSPFGESDRDLITYAPLNNTTRITVIANAGGVWTLDGNTGAEVFGCTE